MENILFEINNRVGIVTVNRPQSRNMLNKAARLELLSVLDSIRNTPDIGVLIITGSGTEIFMSGELEELRPMSPLELAEFLDTLGQQLYTRIEQLDIPVIAAINGMCAGAGAEIAMACDIRIAADTARFGFPEIHLGVMPAGGATQRLTRLVGYGKAKELLLTGDFIGTEEALAIGLINRRVPPGELERAAMDMATMLAKKSAVALKMIKRSVNMAQESGMSAGLAFEACAAVENWNSPDRKEGIEAFFAKREPVFNVNKKT